MRFNKLVVASFSLAFSIAMTGCVGPGTPQDAQANADGSPRENLAPLGPPAPHPQYTGGYPAGQYSQAPYDQTQGRNNAQAYGNPYNAPYAPQNPAPQVYPAPYGPNEGQYAAPYPNQPYPAPQHPTMPYPQGAGPMNQQEQRYEESRQTAGRFDLADRGEGQNAPNQFMGETLTRDDRAAMARPQGFEFPPRAEVRLPAGTRDRVMSRNAGQQERYSAAYTAKEPAAALAAILSAAAAEEAAANGDAMRQQGQTENQTERVVYDPRRDGDFNSFFGLEHGAQTPFPPDTAIPIRPHGAAPAEQKFLFPSLNDPKPFAGATVGRPALDPTRNKTMRPEDNKEEKTAGTTTQQERMSAANLFSESSLPQEALSKPGLFPVNGEADGDDWPETLAPVRPLRPAAKPALRPAQTQQKRINIDLGTSQETPGSQSHRRESATTSQSAQTGEEIFVPDLFFSGR